MTKEVHEKNGCLTPAVLQPLSPEEALSRFMRVNPKKVDEHLIKQGVKKEKKK